MVRHGRAAPLCITAFRRRRLDLPRARVALASMVVVQLLSDRGSGLDVSMLAMLVIGAPWRFFPASDVGDDRGRCRHRLVAFAISDPPFASFIAMLAAVFGSARLGDRRALLAAVGSVLLVSIAVASREFGSSDAEAFNFVIPIVLLHRRSTSRSALRHAGRPTTSNNRPCARRPCAASRKASPSAPLKPSARGSRASCMT